MSTQVKENLYRAGYSGLTHSDISVFINQTLSAGEQSLVTEMIEEAEDQLARDCNRNFDYNDGSDDIEYKATIDSNIFEYFTFNFPIKKVTRIDIDGTQYYDSEDEDEYVFNSDFFVEDTHLRFDTRFSSEVNTKNSVVVYYTIEKFWGSDVKKILRKMVAQLFLNREYGGKKVSNFNVPQLSVGFDPNSLEKEYRAVVRRYKKVLV